MFKMSVVLNLTVSTEQFLQIFKVWKVLEDRHGPSLQRTTNRKWPMGYHMINDVM